MSAIVSYVDWVMRGAERQLGAMTVDFNGAVKGHWWLPGDPDRRIFGVLERVSGAWRLELGASLQSKEEFAAWRDGSDDTMQTIHGITLEHSRPVTLLQSFPTNSTVRSPGGRIHELWTGNDLVEGVHLDEDDDGFDRLTVRSPALLSWYGRTTVMPRDFDTSPTAGPTVFELQREVVGTASCQTP